MKTHGFYTLFLFFGWIASSLIFVVAPRNDLAYLVLSLREKLRFSWQSIDMYFEVNFNQAILGHSLALQESGFSVGRKPVRWRSDVTPPTPRIIQDGARVRCFTTRAFTCSLIDFLYTPSNSKRYPLTY